MTAFTISAGGTTEWDSLSGGSVNATLDTYAISNGTTLRVAVDTYQCTNHSAAFGSVDTVSYSGTGGKLLLDGTLVRVIPFNTGLGTVPAIGTSVVQGAVSGPLLGVWANWQSEPLAAAAAMPAAGWIKVKAVTGGAFSAGLLTGVMATATGPDRIGWIEARGADTATITVPRTGAFEVSGLWFELGTTTGVRGQILECPTTATVVGVWPGVWIETAAASGIYERFAGAGSLVNAATTPTDERGKIVWQTAAGIRIGSDGTNNVGFLPPSGCRVRIPNVIMTCCIRTAGGSGPRVLPNAALATRQEFVTTASGDIKLTGAVMQWYGNFLQAFRADVKDSAISDSLILQEIAAPLNVDNVIAAPTQAQLNFAFNSVSCFGGGTVKDSLFVRFSLAAAGAYVNQFNFGKGITLTNVKSQTLTNRANATVGTWTVTQALDCTWTAPVNIGGRMLHVGSQRPVHTGLRYADNFSGTTGTTNPMYAIEATTGTTGAIVDGVDFIGLVNQQPYNGLVSAANSYATTVRNIGTYAVPLSLGATNASGVIFNGGGNNDGVRLQKIYTSNTRTGPWAFVNSDNNIVIQDVKADYADTSVIAALNCIAKGVSLLGATTGQTAVYGTHWKDSFRSATVGAIEILCNEPTATSAAQCFISSGLPQFNSAGQVALTVVGQQVTWEMPHFARGHTALANLAATITGTNTANVSYEFQADKGAGYGGTWLTLNAANLTAQGAITPATGVRLKVRATCTVANAGNLLTNIAIPTVTTSVDQGASPYPLDVTTVTFTGLQIGTDIVVLTAGTATILAQQDSNSGATYDYVYEGTPIVDVGFIKTGFVPLYLRGLVLGAVNASIPIAMTADRSFI